MYVRGGRLTQLTSAWVHHDALVIAALDPARGLIELAHADDRQRRALVLGDDLLHSRTPMTAIARTAATGGALDPRFLRWQTSLPIDRRLLSVDCQGSIAHVEGQRRAGLLSDEEARVLTSALESLPARVAAGEVTLPEDEEDVHMAIEAWLRAEVGAVASKLHAGRSRNDQVATDLKLWSRGAVAKLRATSEALARAAEAWIERHGELAMPAYTHRQVAIPVLARV